MHWKTHLHNLSFRREGLCAGKRWDGVVFKFSWPTSLFWLKERLDVKEALSHSEMSQKCSCQWEGRQATGMTPYVPDDFGKTLTATQEGKLFSLLFSQAASWLKAKWVTLLDTPNQPTALIFHTDGSCVSKQHAAKDKRRRECWSRVRIHSGYSYFFSLIDHDYRVKVRQGKKEKND